MPNFKLELCIYIDVENQDEADLAAKAITDGAEALENSDSRFWGLNYGISPAPTVDRWGGRV